MPIDWLLNRFRQWRETGLPPAHLLRVVFDECATYAEARERLTHDPICLPAIFTLAGTNPGEGCVIERIEGTAAIHEAPVCASNHWQSSAFSGSTSRSNSEGRLAAMTDCYRDAKDDPNFAWLTPPIFNETTRLAVSANPAQGTLYAQGLEETGAVTRWTAVSARNDAPKP
ncbi:MAG: hypothetical protein HOH66_04815 [Rhodospirillaceae bacterium]|nr:hypothetical protein [Rhodospirillaceae bacterium]